MSPVRSVAHVSRRTPSEWRPREDTNLIEALREVSRERAIAELSSQIDKLETGGPRSGLRAV